MCEISNSDGAVGTKAMEEILQATRNIVITAAVMNPEGSVAANMILTECEKITNAMDKIVDLFHENIIIKMEPAVKAVWINALRHGPYIARGAGDRTEDAEGNILGHSFLGVLFELAALNGVGWWGDNTSDLNEEIDGRPVLYRNYTDGEPLRKDASHVPWAVQKWSGLRAKAINDMIDIEINNQNTFEPIIAYIEENL